MTSSEEITKLSDDFQTEPQQLSLEPAVHEVDIDNAIEMAGGGCGLVLYSVGPFLLFCLEGAEIVVLSIIAVILKCEWNLSTISVAVLQSVALVGYMISSFASSTMGDKFGRRPMALIGAVGTTVTGIASGFTTSFWQLVFLRVILGISVGIAVPSAAALSAEIAPIKYRSVLLSFTSLAWGVGCSLTSALAYFVIKPYGWRGLFIGTSLLFSPSILFLALINESPRFDARKGNLARAERTVNSIARYNRANIKQIKLKMSGVATSDECEGSASAFRKIKSLGLFRDFIVINVFSTFVMFLYYCLSYATPLLVKEGYCTEKHASTNDTCTFNNDSLFDIGVIGLFEPLGIIVAVILIDIIGRRRTFQMSNGLVFLSLTMLYFCVNDWYKMTFLIISKFGTAQVGWAPTVFNVEYFPTSIRAFVLSFGMGLQRFGALVGLASTNFLFEAGPRVLLAVCHAAVIVLGISLTFLKRETMGTQLQ